MLGESEFDVELVERIYEKLGELQIDFFDTEDEAQRRCRDASPQGEEEGRRRQEGPAQQHQVRRPGAHVPARDGPRAAADPPGRGQPGPRMEDGRLAIIRATLRCGHAMRDLRQSASQLAGRVDPRRQGRPVRQQHLERAACRPRRKASASCGRSTSIEKWQQARLDRGQAGHRPTARTAPRVATLTRMIHVAREEDPRGLPGPATCRPR